MKKETVLASLRTTLTYTDNASEWASRSESWIRDESLFFGEFRGQWDEQVVSTTKPLVADYFSDLGLADTSVLDVRVTEAYAGSWVIDAVLIMHASASGAYVTLKGLAEIPRIVDGLIELKNRILGARLEDEINEKARSALVRAGDQDGLPEPPAKAIEADLVLDARPMLGLREGTFRAHAVHLAVALSGDSLSIENLGDEPLQNARLGVFVGNSPKSQWSFAEAFQSSVPSLAAHQTLVKSESDFRNGRGQSPSIEGGGYIDCWVEDRNGIYLFQFGTDDS